jgi:3-oxoadipate enol-lactonase
MLAPPLPPGREIKLPRRGTTFYREVAGPPGAPTLLLLHGWTASADLNWFRCYAPLGRRFRVIAIDHRGHGRGIRTRRPFRLADCADDAVALLDELGIDRVIPVGYSMGGPIAQLVWKRHPDRVDGLVLCATSRNFGRSAPERAMFTSLLGLSGVAMMTPQSVRKRVADKLFVGRFNQSPLAQWAAEELRRNDPATILQAGWSIGAFSSADWIGDVNVPTSVVVTTRDHVVNPERQMKLAQSIPNATVHRVPADHDACVLAANVFVPALLEATTTVARRAHARRPAVSST